MTAYLRDEEPKKRRSYAPYIGSVYDLDDDEQSIMFQDECLLPSKDRGRTRILLLVSNAHPQSIENGMFHTAESGVADLWLDLRETKLFSADDSVLAFPGQLRKWCLEVSYESPFCFALICYWIFLTFHPKHLRDLFGSEREPPGFSNTDERFRRTLATWQPKAIVSLNDEVFKRVTGKDIQGYTEQLETGIVRSEYSVDRTIYRVFQTYPAGWRYHKNAPRLRRDSLVRIADAVAEPGQYCGEVRGVE